MMEQYAIVVHMFGVQSELGIRQYPRRNPPRTVVPWISLAPYQYSKSDSGMASWRNPLVVDLSLAAALR